MPATTPCGHNFCLGCLERSFLSGLFSSKTSIRFIFPLWRRPEGLSQLSGWVGRGLQEVPKQRSSQCSTTDFPGLRNWPLEVFNRDISIPIFWLRALRSVLSLHDISNLHDTSDVESVKLTCTIIAQMYLNKIVKFEHSIKLVPQFACWIDKINSLGQESTRNLVCNDCMYFDCTAYIRVTEES